MALTYVQYTGNGSQKTFSVPFHYLAPDDVKVRVDGVLVPYTWDSPGVVRITTTPQNGALVDIRRQTPTEHRLVDFANGAVLTEYALDLNALQTFYIVQESADASGGSLGISQDGSYDAGGRRITNVGAPTGPSDVITRGYHDGTLLPELNAIKDQAEAWSDRSRDWAQRPYGSLIFGQDTPTEGYSALHWATEAGQARDTALTYRDRASDWADKAEDVPVEAGKFSARHWAAKAAALISSALLPSIAGKGLNFIRVKSDASGYETRTPAEVRADIGAFPGTGGTVNGNVRAGTDPASTAAIFSDGGVRISRSSTYGNPYIHFRANHADQVELASISYDYGQSGLVFWGGGSVGAVLNSEGFYVNNKITAAQRIRSDADISVYGSSWANALLGPTRLEILSTQSNPGVAVRGIGGTSKEGVVSWNHSTSSVDMAVTGYNTRLSLRQANEAYLNYSTNNNTSMGWLPNGDVRVTHAGTVVWSLGITLSEPRMKDDRKPIDNALAKVNSINGITFTWNDNAGPFLSGKRSVGVLANEIEAILPEAVTWEKNPEGEKTHRTVHYEKLTALLIEAVKELTTEVDRLKANLSVPSSARYNNGG